MEYHFAQDLKAIRAVMDLSQEELANALGVEQVTISRNEQGYTNPSDKLMEKVYAYAFEKHIKLNHLKEMLWLENLQSSHKLLFHGAKGSIEEPLSVYKSRKNNDFGQGFYTGESYEQANSFVSGFEHSCVYFLDFDDKDLAVKKYEVNQEWMMTIAYYRGALDEYKEHPMVKKLVAQSRDCDYIIAPIADNRMFQIIHSFIFGEITDEQCKHCLAATNLGSQYVFLNEKAVNKVRLIERCYISENEKEYYKNRRSSDTKPGEDKVRLARIQYRGKGKYIDEILS